MPVSSDEECFCYTSCCHEILLPLYNACARALCANAGPILAVATEKRYHPKQSRAERTPKFTPLDSFCGCVDSYHQRAHFNGFLSRIFRNSFSAMSTPISATKASFFIVVRSLHRYPFQNVCFKTCAPFSENKEPLAFFTRTG